MRPTQANASRARPPSGKDRDPPQQRRNNGTATDRVEQRGLFSATPR
jgi:hypothetical protein